MLLGSEYQGSASRGNVEFLAPENFSMVEPGVYRSAFPRMKNSSFLKRLKLKSVLPLVPEEYPVALAEFYEANGIRLLSHGLDGNKWPFKAIDVEEFRKALRDVLDPKNRPVLIHCNKGKHRTGSLIGCLRKYRGWALSSIFFEYIQFAAPKARLEDQRFIESFDCRFLEHQELGTSDDGVETFVETSSELEAQSTSEPNVLLSIKAAATMVSV